MQQARPVLIGFILGVLTLIFGIFWAAYITVNHEGIHEQLRERARAALEGKFVISGKDASTPPHDHRAEGHDHGAVEARRADAKGHGHAAEHSHGHEEGAVKAVSDTDGVKKEAASSEPVGHSHSEHESPLMEEAHERLTRGHLHAMGLGLVTIAVSFVLMFINAPAKLKTLASACLGVGGLFYPLAWIIMGYRTTALGGEAAQESVLPIVAFSVPLVLIGLFITLAYLVAEVFRKH